MKQKNICKDLNFSDCELAILRMAVDKAEEKLGKRLIQSEELKLTGNRLRDLFRRLRFLLSFCPMLHSFASTWIC